MVVTRRCHQTRARNTLARPHDRDLCYVVQLVERPQATLYSNTVGSPDNNLDRQVTSRCVLTRNTPTKGTGCSPTLKVNSVEKNLAPSFSNETSLSWCQNDHTDYRVQNLTYLIIFYAIFIE